MNTWVKNIIIFVAIILVLLSFWYFSNIFIYLIISVIISLAAQPIVSFYRKLKIKNWQCPDGLAAILTLFTMGLVVLAILALFIPLVIDEAKMLATLDYPSIAVSFQDQFKQLENLYLTYYNHKGVPFNTFINEKLNTILNSISIPQILQSISNSIGSFFLAIVSVFFITFFLLKDEGMAYNNFMLLIPPKYETQVKNILSASKKLLSRYFLGLCLDMAVVTILVAIGLFIIGVKNALVIAFLAGLLNVVPYVGPWIAAGIGVIIGVSGHLNADLYSAILPLAGKIVSVFILVQILDNIFIQPFIFSNTVKAHPLEIFLITLMAGTLAGITGMIVAIPVYTIIRVVAREFLSNFKLVQKLTKHL